MYDFILLGSNGFVGRNLNIFLTSNESDDILSGVNWSNIAFGGSLIPACITRFNPLELIFESKDRYFKEYYASSDIDVMCNEQDTFKFVDTVYNFFECIKTNILTLNNVEDIGFIEFGNRDVVRNPLVSKIVNNYEKFEKAEGVGKEYILKSEKKND